MPQKFFLYARKSTDVEDKQVLSIEAQMSELRSFAKEQNIEIIEELIEKQSAKMPGRPIFTAMLQRIERGEANGILSWHPDRLARNSVDGGKIIYLLDTGTIVALKFPSFWFESTPQGKFMLNMAFVQSKYYVDALSENTKRGLRQKVRRGEYPGPAPIGYLNDLRTKTIVVNRKRSVIIRKAFELYAENHSRLEDISAFLAGHGIKTSHDKPFSKDKASFILSNPFYVGFFRYGGELHEGKQEAIISKKLFDRVQEILKERGKPQITKVNPKPLTGLLSCATCGLAITAEIQKGHTYYRCTKKKGNCTEPYVREEELDRQLSSLLQNFSLPNMWVEELQNMMESDRGKADETEKMFVQKTRNTITDIQIKLQRLLDSYLEQDIEREVYLPKKAELMSQKKSLEEKMTNLHERQTGWLEPMKKWIETAQNIEKIAQDHDLITKKVMAKEIFGSNLSLRQKVVVVLNQEQHPYPSESIDKSSPKTHWAAVQAAHALVSEKPLSCVLVAEEGVEPSCLLGCGF